MVSYAKTSRIQSLQKETAWQLGAGASVMGIDPQATRQALDTAQRIGVDRTMLAQLKGLIAEGYLVPEDFSGVFSTMGPDLRQIFDTTRMIENRCK
jgi:hypothetical protein